jgi:hypothetical protein
VALAGDDAFENIAHADSGRRTVYETIIMCLE